MIQRIALIGFGEVGQTLHGGLIEHALPTASYDLLYADQDSKPWRLGSKFTDAATSASQATSNADLVISAVTAAQTLAAAKSVTSGLKPGALFLDLNSASPGVKREAAQVIEAASGRYIEAAVMSPIDPKGIATSMLLGGPHAEAVLPELKDFGFAGARFFSAELGKASAAKMCRSVMVKGIEALLSESMLAARHYGVEDTVLKSLDDLFPGPDWPQLARYMISRTMEHGTRRAEEMREAARTMSEAGIDPHMSLATAERQAWAPTLAAALDEAELAPMLDAMRNAMEPKR